MASNRITANFKVPHEVPRAIRGHLKTLNVWNVVENHLRLPVTQENQQEWDSALLRIQVEGKMSWYTMDCLIELVNYLDACSSKDQDYVRGITNPRPAAIARIPNGSSNDTLNGEKETENCGPNASPKASNEDGSKDGDGDGELNPSTMQKYPSLGDKKRKWYGNM